MAVPLDDKQNEINGALRKYRLPSGGEFPFIPPKGWFPTMPLWPGGGRGFDDCKGRRWQPGRSITPGQPFEWDVQLPGGKHINVDLEGNISHGAEKKSAAKTDKSAKPIRKGASRTRKK